MKKDINYYLKKVGHDISEVKIEKALTCSGCPLNPYCGSKINKLDEEIIKSEICDKLIGKENKIVFNFKEMN